MRRKVSTGQKQDCGVREVHKQRRKTTGVTQLVVESCRITKCDIRILLVLTKKFYIERLLGQRAQSSSPEEAKLSAGIRQASLSICNVTEGWNSCGATTWLCLLCRGCAGALARDLQCLMKFAISTATVSLTSILSAPLGEELLWKSPALYCLHLSHTSKCCSCDVFHTFALQGEEELDLVQRMLHLNAFRRMK